MWHANNAPSLSSEWYVKGQWSQSLILATLCAYVHATSNCSPKNKPLLKLEKSVEGWPRSRLKFRDPSDLKKDSSRANDLLLYSIRHPSSSSGGSEALVATDGQGLEFSIEGGVPLPEPRSSLQLCPPSLAFRSVSSESLGDQVFWHIHLVVNCGLPSFFTTSGANISSLAF